MSTISEEQLLRFITVNHLKKDNGIVCFEASIELLNPYKIKFTSEIQVISLPTEYVLYVLNLPPDLQTTADMYSTNRFNFRYIDEGQLEIAAINGNRIVLINPKAV